MTEQYNIDLNHLTVEEAEIFYQRYLTEKASDLVKEYNLKPSLTNTLYSLFLIDKCHAACEICGETHLSSKKITKREFASNTPVARKAKCSSCEHKQYVSDDLSTVLMSVDSCYCDFCEGQRTSINNLKKQQQIELEENERKEKTKRIVDAFTIDRRYIPFTEPIEEFNLTSVAMLMALMFARWNNIHDRENDDDFIAPYNKDSEIPIYPEQANSDSHPLIQCIRTDLVFFDLKRCTFNDFVIEENGSVSFYSRQLHLQTNFVDADYEQLSIPQTYEWLSRKFTDGFWYRDWDAQLLDVWLDLGVAECIEYAKSKAEEYNFGFASEAKISEIIRDLLHRFSVSECFYFISTSYWNAAAFFQSNKATSRRHAENTVPGKIISLANSGNLKQWTRPASIPRSAFSVMLFDVMLNSKNDAGFHLCPGKNYQDLLNKTKVSWPDIEVQPLSIEITGESGLYEFYGLISETNFEESADTAEVQLAHLARIAQVLGLNKAAIELNEQILSTTQSEPE